MNSNFPLLSVVVPLYNSQSYMKETIQSIIGQTLGFRDNIQLILIDDGSTDGSASIAKEYQSEYPDNILYKYKENGGVSSARNAGFSFAEGKYVTFCDSDDRWSADSFKNMISLFEDHYDEINLVTARIMTFGSKESDHPLNFKYDETRVIDLKKEPYYVQSTMGNVIFKRSVLAEVPFDVNVNLLEDTLLNTQILMKDMKYGVVAEACYYYRKYDDDRSLSSWNHTNAKWYLDVPKQVFFPLLEKSCELYGKPDIYTQSVIAYFLRWRVITNEIHDTLSDDQLKEYTDIYRDLLQKIDDTVIASVYGLKNYQRNFMLKMKYGEDLFTISDYDSGAFKLGDIIVFNAKSKGLARITSVRSSLFKTSITGKSTISLSQGKCTLHAEDLSGREIPVEMTEKKELDMYAFTGECIYRGYTFTFDLPKKEKGRFRIYTKIAGKDEKFYCEVSFSSKINGSYDPDTNITEIR